MKRWNWFAVKALRRACKHYGLAAVERSKLYDWQCELAPGPVKASSQSRDAASYLQRDNPRLRHLEAVYRDCPGAVTTPLVWTDGHVTDTDLLRFRGDNAYVWQLRGRNMNPLAYALTAYYVKAIDALGLFEQLQEDSDFGAHLFDAAGRQVSRDLLDSIIEIHFLEKHLGLSRSAGLCAVDVGAGYGRFVHRLATAFPRIGTCLLTDAVPVSTFLAEFYLRHRGLEARAVVVPLNAIEASLRSHRPALAVNIHSFSECTLDAIAWWVGLLAANGVRYLFVVPNNLTPGAPSLLNARREDFGPIMTNAGYTLATVEPKYGDPVVQQYGVNPAYYHLFELR